MGIDQSTLSPELQRKLTFAGTNSSAFKTGSESLLELMDLAVDAKQVERVTERIGHERCAERDAAVEQYQSLPLVKRKDKPADVTAPELAVVMVDGGRVQIRNEEDKDAKEKTAAAAEAENSALPPDEQHRGTHWREDKIGVLMTMKSVASTSDPCPEVPSAFVDPTRITKLTRELKTKKSASVTEAKQVDASR